MHPTFTLDTATFHRHVYYLTSPVVVGTQSQPVVKLIRVLLSVLLLHSSSISVQSITTPLSLSKPQPHFSFTLSYQQTIFSGEIAGNRIYFSVMLPKSDPQLLESPPLVKKPKTTDYSSDRKITLYSIQSFMSTHPRTWLLLSILSLQILLLFVIYSLPVSFSFRHFSPPNNLSINKERNENNISEEDKENVCEFGKVYVYDLPAMFNKELSEKCDELNPWHSRCEAISNDGLGRKADTLAGVVPENLTHSWYWTDQFASEIIFHNRILGHKCRTLDPESASAFYLPFYAGLAVGKYLWSDNYTNFDRDYHCQMLLKWVQDQIYWKRSNGWDHFIMLGRISWDFRRSKNEDWGSRSNGWDHFIMLGRIRVVYLAFFLNLFVSPCLYS